MKWRRFDSIVYIIKIGFGEVLEIEMAMKIVLFGKFLSPAKNGIVKIVEFSCRTFQ